MGAYSIKDLEQLSGIKAHTIRMWEQRYGIVEPQRTDTNIRYYDDQQLKHLLNIALLSKHGYKISKISKLNPEQFNAAIERLYEQTLLHETDVELDLDANDLMVSMIDMDEDKFHRIYENSVKNNGFEKTITGLIYPFLEKVGILWSIGQINPAQEHFMSCLIRQKIISGIDRLPAPKEGKKFLLFLPEGEHHEIGLLMAHYLLKKKGARVYFMGQNLPSKDIRQSIQTVQPHAVLTFFVDPAVINNAANVIAAFKNGQENCDFLIATRPSPELNALSSDKVHLLHSIKELDNYL
jgi:DNA-binding transcriptional MerR regulator